MLIVEDEPDLAQARRDGRRLEAITADTVGDGDNALGLLSLNASDIAVLDRDLPGPSADTVSALRKRLGEPPVIANVARVGYRIETPPDSGREGEDHG